MHQIDLEFVYILHTRSYSDTSLIVELMSQTHGRVSTLARSARGPTSRYQGKLQLFTPMLASWSGRYELKNLGTIELDGIPHQLDRTPLFCGFYLNELLMRLLHKEDPYPRVFELYRQSLLHLEKNHSIAPTLRLFEKKLLDELGYGLPLTQEAETRLSIHTDRFYRYKHRDGFFPCDPTDPHCFSGVDLLSIAAERFESDATLSAAKRLMRYVLSDLLGNKLLQSRLFFQ